MAQGMIVILVRFVRPLVLMILSPEACLSAAACHSSHCHQKGRSGGSFCTSCGYRSYYYFDIIIINILQGRATQQDRCSFTLSAFQVLGSRCQVGTDTPSQAVPTWFVAPSPHGSGQAFPTYLFPTPTGRSIWRRWILFGDVRFICF